MKKILFTCFLASAFLLSPAVNKVIVKPFIEGRGMKGWLIDSIRICDTATIVYGQFGLGKGWTSSGDLDNYIEISSTGKQFKQTGLRGLPLSPEKITGTGKQEYFEFIFQPIDPDTQCINITNKDFNGKDAAWYGVWLCPRPNVFSGQLAGLNKLEGNWFSTDGTGQWKAGFYEKKVYWNKEFWNFKVLKGKGNSAGLELYKQGNKNIKMDVIMKADSSLTVIANKIQLSLFKRPLFKLPDNSAFNYTFSKNDSLLVSGYYPCAHPVFTKHVALIVQDILSDKPAIFPTDIAIDGTFSVKIPFNHLAKVTFSNQLGPQSPLSEVSFFAEPGNHIVLTYRNENEKDVVFGGDNERLNNEFQAFSITNPYFVSEKKASDMINSNPATFTSWRTAKIEKVKQAYSTWQSLYPADLKMNSFMQFYLKYALVSDLTKGAVYGKKPDEILNFLPAKSDTSFYNNPDALFVPEYVGVIKGIKDIQRKDLNITFAEISSFIQKNDSPTGREKDILHKFEIIESNLKSKDGIQLYLNFIKENKNQLDSLFKKYKLVITELKNNKMEEVKQKYDLPKGFGEDLGLIREFGNILARGNAALTESQLSILSRNDINQDLKEQLLQRNKEVEIKLEKMKLEKIKATNIKQGVKNKTVL